MTTGWFILFGFGALAGAAFSARRFARAWLALTLLGAGMFVLSSVAVLSGWTIWDCPTRVVLGTEPVHLRLDGLGAWFLALAGVVGAAGAVYMREYWSDAAHPDSAGRGRVWWTVLLASMALVLMEVNGLHFLIAWELFALAAYFLITLDREQNESRAAGWLYLAASHTGTLVLFGFFALLAAKTGSWELGPMRERAELAPLFWGVLFGFGIKAGLFPLHIWLPSAHANAPSHVSAIMSGVAIKMGLFGVIRFTGWLPMPPEAGWVLLGLGAVSAVLGAAFALAQNDIKRLLAYCSVENMGVIFIGLGAAVLGQGPTPSSWGRLAFAGALVHVWNHGLFKALLFFGAGSVMHATGTREISRLGGLWKAMPWTASLFAFGAAAISALPPLNGFVSEWLVYLGLLDGTTHHTSVTGGLVAATIALGMTGALALAGFVKAGGLVFGGAPRSAVVARAHESGWWMRGPMLALAMACAGMAWVPFVIWPWLNAPLAAWTGQGQPLEVPASLRMLSLLQVSLALLICLLMAVVLRRVRLNGQRGSLTWDCGYARPSARMQYTGASFAGLAGGWFKWILQPERRLHRPRGPFPERADLVERIPETVLEKGVGQFAQAVMAASAWVRRRQQGHLPEYILYVVAGLAALGAFVMFGSTP